jgi:hypothetical protein
VLAAIVTIVAVLELVERDWLRGAIGLVLGAAFALSATGFRERSVAGKRIHYALLSVALILLVIRLFTRLGT